jgi:hypothetical protein
MPPAVVFFEIPAFHRREDEWLTGGENWDEELVVPGRMVYVGQGQAQFLRIDEVEPGMMWPKRKKKKKKASSTPPPPPAPAPALTPAPIDWGDWEELCQAAPPLPPPPPPPVWEFPYEELTSPVPAPWEPEDWDAEIAASQWEPEDWDAEIAASQWEPEDWDAEIAASQWEPEDWDAELASQWEPEDWDAELASQ